jgi:hypothetical protein
MPSTFDLDMIYMTTLCVNVIHQVMYSLQDIPQRSLLTFTTFDEPWWL